MGRWDGIHILSMILHYDITHYYKINDKLQLFLLSTYYFRSAITHMESVSVYACIYFNLPVLCVNIDDLCQRTCITIAIMKVYYHSNNEGVLPQQLLPYVIHLQKNFNETRLFWRCNYEIVLYNTVCAHYSYVAAIIAT